MRFGSAWAPTLVLLLAAAGDAAAAPADVAPELRTIEDMRASGEIATAAKQAADLVAQHPDSLDAHIAHQDLQLALGKEKELVDVYRGGVKAPDASADAHYLLGRLLRGASSTGEFRAALKADPRHFLAMCGLGAELTRSRSWGEAKSVLESAAKERPTSGAPVNALGRLEEARGKTAEAEKLYRAAIELDPALTMARVNLGVLLLGAGKKDDAMKTLQEAASKAPKDPMPLVAIGMAHAAAKDYKAASDAYRKAASVDQGDVTSLNLLANAYVDLDMPDLADDALKQALKRAPACVETQVNLAYVRMAKQLYDEAMLFARKALELDDECAEAHYVLGVVYDHQLQYKKAEAEFSRAEALDEDNPAFVRASGALAATAGEWGRAIEKFGKAAKMADNDSNSLMALADAYIGGGKFRAAASTYDQVVAAEPKQLDAWLKLGIVCARDLKEYKRALKALREYVKAGGKDPRVAKWIAWIEKQK
jgi:tetratricopeptide (TPR) repeat protein